MTEDLRKRLIGAAVLVSLGIIFIPMLIEEKTVIDSDIYKSNIPEKAPMTFSKPAVSEQELEKRKQDFAFGTTITPAEDTEVEDNPDVGVEDQAVESSTVNISTRTGLTSWMVQVGSFSNLENATKVVEQLRQAGYDTHLETAQVQSKTVHRVRVGPEVDRNRADEIAQAITKKFFLTASVIRYP
jgi:DedD protein